MSSGSPFTTLETQSIFSEQRLGQLQKIYNLSEKNTLLLHAQLGLLNGTIYASISLFEVHFRNIIVGGLQDIFTDDWMSEQPFSDDRWLKSSIKRGEKAAKKDKYSKLPYQERKRRKLKYAAHTSAQRKNYAINAMEITESDVISHLYFSFWRSLFSKTYEPHLWNRGLRHIFPKKSVSRGQVSGKLEICIKVRNRISHNEFIHPHMCHDYIAAITFLTKELRYKGKIRANRVHQFHAPYIEKIKLQLIELEHFLNICK